MSRDAYLGRRDEKCERYLFAMTTPIRASLFVLVFACSSDSQAMTGFKLVFTQFLSSNKTKPTIFQNARFCTGGFYSKGFKKVENILNFTLILDS